MSLNALTRQAMALLRHHHRSLLVLYLTFTGLSIAVITPLVTAALSALRPLTGDAAITTGGLLEFLTSAGGGLWLLITVLFTALLIILQQASITLIAAQPKDHSLRATTRALWGVGRRFPALAALATLQTAAHLVLALPFITGVGIAWHLLLTHYDPYLLNLERPAILWWFAGFCAVMFAGLALVNGALFLRWILAIPILMLEGVPPIPALRQSLQRTAGTPRTAAGTLALGILAIFLAPALVTLTFNLLAASLFQVLPETMPVLLPTVILLIGGYLLTGLALTFLASSALGTLIVARYQSITGHQAHWLQPSVTPPSTRTGLEAWLLEGLVIVLVLLQGFWVVTSLEQNDHATITAHRGSAFKAPENSLSAIHQAVRDGADYIEIDVQLTRDGVAVLWHDADMQRIFGKPERITDVDFEDIQALDAGSWFDVSFAGENIATLAQAIDAVRGQSRLFVDLKPNRNEEALVAEVIRTLQDKDAVEGTILAAADWPVLEQAKNMEPRLKTALLAQFVVGPLWQDRYDILALRMNRANPAAVARAHKADNELHVWTVNQPQDMARFLDMGVDNIITDRPDVLAKLLAEREARSESERLVMQVRNWLR